MSVSIDNRLEKQTQTRCLVADIGGTHARFAIAKKSVGVLSEHKLVLEHQHSFQVQKFDTIASALHAYLQGIPAASRPKTAKLAVATAVTGDQISFTNSHWGFSKAHLKNEMAFEELEVINDFAAVAWALPLLQTADVESLGLPSSFEMEKTGTYAALGPGTGLGVAALKMEPHQNTVLETEGGHIGYAPRTEDEIRILKFLQKDFGRVSYERLLCGNGLVNLYRARSELMQLPASLHTPEAVSSGARQHDLAAQKAAHDFCSILGAFAGDATLMFGAWSGIFLAGGLLPHLMDEKGKLLFRQAFEDKGRFSPLLEKTPAWIIKRSDIGTLGAANLWLRNEK